MGICLQTRVWFQVRHPVGGRPEGASEVKPIIIVLFVGQVLFGQQPKSVEQEAHGGQCNNIVALTILTPLLMVLHSAVPARKIP